jgi:hypothetical protein
MTKETEPRVLSDAELDHVHGGTITTEKVNKQGHVVSDNSNGQTIDTVSVNPQGHRPPGQN